MGPRRRIIRWLTERLETVPVVVTIELVPLTSDEDAPSACVITVPKTEHDVGGIALELAEQILQELDRSIDGLHVRALDKRGKVIAQTRLRQAGMVPVPGAELDIHPADGFGAVVKLFSQQHQTIVRLHETLLRQSMSMAEFHRDLAETYRDRDASDLEARLRLVHLVEELASGQHERTMELNRASRIQDRKDKAIDFVLQKVAPHVAKRMGIEVEDVSAADVVRDVQDLFKKLKDQTQQSIFEELSEEDRSLLKAMLGVQ